MNSYRRRHPDHPKYDAKRDDPSHVAEAEHKEEPEDEIDPEMDMSVFAARYRKEREQRLHGPDVRARAVRQKKGKGRHDD